MKFLSKTIIILSLLSAPALADQEIKTVTSVVPIFSQKIEHKLPQDWKPAFENATEGHYILEFLPQNETLEDWTEMFIVQGFKGISSKTSPKLFLKKMADINSRVCGDNAVFEYLEEEKISGFEAQKAISGCASLPKNSANDKISEISYFIAIKGAEDIYLLHKAKRGE